jgi:DNA uptake protein ComE-like DNA-binding protein
MQNHINLKPQFKYQEVKMAKAKKSQKGSVLILVLIVLTLLSSMALQAAYQINQSNRLIQIVKRRFENSHLTMGKVFKVVEELILDGQDEMYDSKQDAWRRKYMLGENILALRAKNLDRENIAKYQTYIIDEESKINLNTSDVETLRRLFNQFKGVKSNELAQEVIVYREAKEEFKKFYSKFELLQMKNLKRDVFLGEDLNENGLLDSNAQDAGQTFPEDNNNGVLDFGIKDYLTIYGDGLVNINTASRNVLISMPNMTEELVDVIVQTREKKPFEKLQELKDVNIITEKVFLNISKWAKIKSDWYHVSVTLEDLNEKRVKSISAIIDRSNEEDNKIASWSEYDY